jgi:lipoate-protein ligase A
MSFKHPFRLLSTGFHTGFYNMGLDEALLEAVSSGASLPVLRFYGWKPATVTLGYFQSLEDEIDKAACFRHGVDIVRRITGGGAVFHQAEVTYSIILPVTHPLAGATILESYHILCAGITRGLSLLDIDSEFSGINDIIAMPGDAKTGVHAEGRKISGNAQTRRHGCVLQHGTILLDSDIDLMFELLKVPNEKLKDKLIRDVKERVTSLNALLGRDVPFDEATDALTQGFREALSLDLRLSSPTETEEERATGLATGKFASDIWLHKR